MSLDLFRDEIAERMQGFGTTTVAEPGFFEGYMRGSALHTMEALAKTARGVSMLGAAGPVIQDALGIGVPRGGTMAQDRYFKTHADVFQSAVDYWTPRPNEVGAAAQITGSLLGLLPFVIGGAAVPNLPAFAVGSSVMMTGEDLLAQGVRPERATAGGVLMGAGLATGIWMPLLGQNLWQRAVIGGAGLNILQGAAVRGTIGTMLESGQATEAEKKAAETWKAFDLTELTIDALLGIAFGVFTHVNPAMRAQSEETWRRVVDWAKNLKPSEISALAVLREAEHLNKDSFPGQPVDVADIEAHVERTRRAIDQLERGQPVAVDDLPMPRAQPDTAREAEQQANLAEMIIQAEAVRAAEGLPPTPLPDLPPPPPRLETTPEGLPRLTTERVVLDEPRVFHVEQDVQYVETVIRTPEGQDAGVAALGWRGDQVVEILNIQSATPRQGLGADVISGILRHNAPDTEVWIRLIQPEARGFWEKMGATLFDTEEGTDGTLTKAQFDTARANRAVEKAAGRAGAGDEAGARTDTAQQERGPSQEVALGQPVDVVSQRGETRSVTYERLPDGRLQRTTRYNDGESFVESLHTDKKGDEQWVSNEQYERGEYYPVQLSDEAARAKAAEDLADLGTPARRPAEQAQAAATTEPPRTRIEIPADLMAADPETQARAIGQSIEDRLLELGVEPEEARANGAIWEAFFRTLAQKYGVSPGETLASYGIDIRRLDTIEDLPGALAQAARARTLPDTIDVDGVQRTTLNSEGRQIAATEEGVRNFWRWFGDSKVVDDQGRPLVVYHGTTADFDAFRHDARGTNTRAAGAERGFFFSGSEADSNFYIEIAQERARENYEPVPQGRILEVYLKARNPLVLTTFEEANVAANTVNELIDADPVALDYAIANGYDALIWPHGNVNNTAYTTVVFHPEQIKSATGNAGTFDPANPNILRQTATPSEFWYYSALGHAIEKANMGAAPAKGWKDFLKGLTQKGVKPDEIKWSGIEEWLDLQQGRVTKEAVTDYLRNNGVRVEEVLLGQPIAVINTGRRPYDSAIADDTRLLEQSYRTRPEYRQDEGAWVFVEDDGTVYRITDDLAEIFGGGRRGAAIGRALGYLNAADVGRPTKYAQFQLPGAIPGTYRELLLTLPPTIIKVERWQIIRPSGLVDSTYISEESARIQAERRGEGFTVRQADPEELEGGFRSSHFGPLNILAHVRFNERTDADGQRVLFLEEIQSDWAQKGKKEGFTPSDAELAAIRQEYEEADAALARTPVDSPNRAAAEARYSAAIDQYNARINDGNIPRAPFVEKTDQWVALVLKRMIRYAAENGISRIAWTRGEQQVDRYTNALRKAVDTIEWTKTPEGVQLVGYKQGPMRDARRNMTDSEYRRWLELDDIAADRDLTEQELAERSYLRTKYGREKVVDTTEREDALSDAIGKALAKQILDDPNQSGTITGDNIRIDDTGMAQFYDRIVPNVAKEVLKKLGGGKVIEIDANVSEPAQPPGFRWFIMEQRTNSIRGWYQTEREAVRAAQELDPDQPNAFLVEEAPEVRQGKGQKRITQPAIDLPPQMLDKALQGQTLFQRTAAPGEVQAIGEAIKAAQWWEEQRLDGIRQALFDELANEGTVAGRAVDMEGLQRDEAGDLTPEGEAEAARRERAAIDAAAAETPRIVTLEDVDSYGMPAQARDAVKAYLDSIGANYSEEGGWGTSLYLEVRPPEGSKAEDEGHTLKLRFSNHENQSRAHTPTEHNWVEGAAPEGMLRTMLEAARHFAETGEGGDVFFQRAPYVQPDRGVIRFGNGQTTIGLFESANRSTFLHESGHLFLQITRDLVQNEGVPARARQDWERLSQWLEIDPAVPEIPVAAHEKFARGFEAYMREGKAPNMGLQGVFQRFRDWLIDIYHSVMDLRVELSDDVRGIMARMLDSQARDPSVNAEGPAEPAARVSPPPPPAEGGEATPRPEAPPPAEPMLEGPDPWEVEGTIRPQGPEVPYEPVGLDNPDMQDMLRIMADEEAGWEVIGGRLDMSRLADPEKLGTPAFTKWIPKADWWPARDGKLNEAQTREAVRRALAGEKLTKRQQAAIDYMMDVANKRLHAEKMIGSDELAAIGRDLMDEGLSPSTQSLEEVAMIQRAAEIDEARVERAAMLNEADHEAFLNEVRAILDEAAEREAAAPPAEPAGARGQEGAGPRAPEAGAPEQPADPIQAAAERFVAANPTRAIQIVDDDGNVRVMTAAEYLAESRIELERARADIPLYEAAAECLLSGGA